MDQALIARFRSAPELGLHFLLGFLVVVLLPRVSPDNVSTEYVRAAAVVVLGVTLSIYSAEVAIMKTWWWPGIGAYLAVAIAALAATFVAETRTLWSIPASGLVGASAVFMHSLVRPPSIIERAAFWLQPKAPEFIRRYCRATSAVWAFILLAAGLGVAITSWVVSASAGRSVVGWVPAVVGVWAAAEFFLRKWWFRHYEDNWIDRVLARIFPWERTERGRRSQAYIASVRAGEARDIGTGPVDTA